ncbi:DUF4197 domain-containing protein [Tsuneonella suprasediminis]|uniref:DUF4197 domain-containing protein n=1 Tax=Tsuneonella suprasediminis TaxID=2306996 RepID=A0A419R0C0_9SPHN|nr:DUF4197 domain-containing protein [Tsuneonella suprasediminis]RJX66737.1 DUF4197 domain-containing protein [Tsuneonella suprasediminis]UBS32476.1 DUF4197 domain-containing protein [Altererythrobacter sp. N1]
MTSSIAISPISPVGRRTFLAGIGAAGLLALPGCATYGGYSFTDAIARLLFLSSERAFDRMAAPGGFWDQQIAQVGFEDMLGARGGVLARILTSGLFKDRLANALAPIAYRGAQRAAPVVADTIRVIGFENAVDLVRGGPTAATSYLQAEMGNRLIDAMLPEVGDGLRVAQDPIVGQALAALTGVDIPQVANRFSTKVNDVIWQQMGIEEADIRANPRSTNDPLIMGVFGVGARL